MTSRASDEDINEAAESKSASVRLPKYPWILAFRRSVLDRTMSVLPSVPRSDCGSSHACFVTAARWLQEGVFGVREAMRQRNRQDRPT